MVRKIYDFPVFKLSELAKEKNLKLYKSAFKEESQYILYQEFKQLQKKVEKEHFDKLKEELKNYEVRISKEIEEKPTEEKLKEKPLPSHITNTYECTCLVSERKLTHLFAVREEVIEIMGSFEAVHNDSYPDHTLLNFEFVNTFDIEDKGFYYSNSVTDKQKKFLKQLGYSEEEISFINTKKEASRIISRR